MEEIKERRTTMKDIMNFFQVGMTNPSPKLQARRFQSDLPNANLSVNGQQSTSQSPSSIGRFNRSPKVLPSPNIAMKNIHTSSQLLKNNKTIQNILNNVPITHIQSSPTLSKGKKGLSIIYLCFFLKYYYYYSIQENQSLSYAF
jgi:hypothetical protein